MLSATSDDRLSALRTRGVSGRFAVVPAIREELDRVTAMSASLAGHAWEVGDYRAEQ